MDLDLNHAQEANIQNLSLDILQLISDARNQHGIRSLDYAAYRQYCSSKVHRLRQLLSLTHADPNHQPKSKSSSSHGAKSAAKKSKGSKKAAARRQNPASQSAAEKGKGNQFTRKTLQVAKVENDRPVQLLLFEAERAWAHSQDLRNQSFEKDQDAKLRKIGLDRGTRAINWSSSLLSLLKSLGPKVDVVTLAQASSYHLLLMGVSNFDKGNHEKSLETLSLSRRLLNSLTRVSQSSKEEALANSFIDNMEAMIRFSCYSLGMETNVADLDEVTGEHSTEEVGSKWLANWKQLMQDLERKEGENQVASDSKEKKREKLEIDWNGRKIQIRNPELVDEIEKVRREESNLKSSEKSSKTGGEEDGGNVRSTGEKKEKKSKIKRERLTHAQRNAKKRGDFPSKNPSSTSQGQSNKVITKSNSLNPLDSLLVTLTSASEISSRLLSDHSSALAKSHSARYASAGEDLRNVNEWILYKLFALRIRRNDGLMREVELKAERRERRSKERIEKKIQSIKQNGGKQKNPNRNKKKKIVPEKKQRKRNLAGSKAKRQRSSPKNHRNRPARSGTRALKAKRVESRSKQLEKSERESSFRRSFRLIPSLTRLLDSTLISLDSISELSLCESNPDIASLIECKSYLNKSQILRILAKGWSLASFTFSKESSSSHDSKGQSQFVKAKIQSLKVSLFLLERSKLFLRQSKGSLDLIDRDELDLDLDLDFPKHVLQQEEGSEIFEAESNELERLTKEYQKSLWLTLREEKNLIRTQSDGKVGDGSELATGKVTGGVTAGVGIGKDGLPNTKSSNILRECLAKILELDSREIEEASKIPPSRSKEFQSEFSPTANMGSATSASGGLKQGKLKAHKVAKGAEVSSEDDEADFRDADAGSTALEDQDEEEDEEAEFDEAEEFDQEEEDERKKEGDGNGNGQKKGWLGGWFSR